MLICEVPSFEQDRRSGESSLHPLRDGTRILRLILSMEIAPHPRHRGRPSCGPGQRDDDTIYEQMDEQIVPVRRCTEDIVIANDARPHDRNGVHLADRPAQGALRIPVGTVAGNSNGNGNGNGAHG